MADAIRTVPPGPSGHGWAWLLAMGFFILEAIPFHIWFLRRRHLEPIKSRQWQLAILTTVSLSVYVVISCVCTYILFEQRDGYLPATLRPTTVISIVSMIVMPGMVWPIYLRAFVLYYRCVLSDAQLRPELVHKRWLLRNRWVISFWFMLTCYFVNLAIHATIGVVGTLVVPKLFFPFVIVQAVLTIGIAILLAVLLWRKREDFSFKNELIAIAFVGIPGMTLWALSITKVLATIDAAVWMVIMSGTLVNVMLIYPLVKSYAREKQMRRFDSEGSLNLMGADDVELTGQSELLGTKQHKLSRLLADQDILEGFRNFCVECWCTESLLFYFDATQYATLPDDESRLTEARRMWSMYLERNAPLELNVDDTEVAAVKASLDRNEADAALFEKMRTSILRILYEDTYRRWRTTPSFAAIKAKKNIDDL